MASIVIVVPKDDECDAVRHVFGVESENNAEVLDSSGTRIWRTRIDGATIAIAQLGRQTNTYSGVLTLELIHHENPRQMYLVGTALGNPATTDIGSVVICSDVTDISERRPNANNGAGWTPSGELAPPRNLLSEARDFVVRSYTDAERRREFFNDLEHGEIADRGQFAKAKAQILEGEAVPFIAVEPLLSGNEYFMSGEEGHRQVWDSIPGKKAYDMEAAGFALATKSYSIPWLVFRGVSDHGSRETKMDRRFVTQAAATVLRKFLESDSTRPKRITSSKPRLPGRLAAQLTHTFSGHMGYLDDDKNVVIYNERVDIRMVGEILHAKISSTLSQGTTASQTLEYQAEIRLGGRRTVSGIWAPGEPNSDYSGSLTGRVVLGDDSGESTRYVEGVWSGGHGEGDIRIGRFIWYNSDYIVSLGSLKADLEANFRGLILGMSACEVS